MVKKKKNLNKKSILVTGGSGFIGAAIVKYLVKEGHNVTVFDNNSRGKLSRFNWSSRTRSFSTMYFNI